MVSVSSAWEASEGPGAKVLFPACFVHWDNPWKPAFVIRTVPCNLTYLPTYLPSTDRSASDAGSPGLPNKPRSQCRNPSLDIHRSGSTHGSTWADKTCVYGGPQRSESDSDASGVEDEVRRLDRHQAGASCWSAGSRGGEDSAWSVCGRAWIRRRIRWAKCGREGEQREARGAVGQVSSRARLAYRIFDGVSWIQSEGCSVQLEWCTWEDYGVKAEPDPVLVESFSPWTLRKPQHVLASKKARRTGFIYVYHSSSLSAAYEKTTGNTTLIDAAWHSASQRIRRTGLICSSVVIEEAPGAFGAVDISYGIAAALMNIIPAPVVVQISLGQKPNESALAADVKAKQNEFEASLREIFPGGVVLLIEGKNGRLLQKGVRCHSETPYKRLTLYGLVRSDGRNQGATSQPHCTRRTRRNFLCSLSAIEAIPHGTLASRVLYNRETYLLQFQNPSRPVFQCKISQGDKYFRFVHVNGKLPHILDLLAPARFLRVHGLGAGAPRALCDLLSSMNCGIRMESEDGENK
ncbi:hypothetical protein DFH09DRAFT_1094012 [Mycena vulgaris]|nr:hypothetical protein DFH09DRAFT_1094012 [Mycena vulgaris]